MRQLKSKEDKFNKRLGAFEASDISSGLLTVEDLHSVSNGDRKTVSAATRKSLLVQKEKKGSKEKKRKTSNEGVTTASSSPGTDGASSETAAEEIARNRLAAYARSPLLFDTEGNYIGSRVGDVNLSNEDYRQVLEDDGIGRIYVHHMITAKLRLESEGKKSQWPPYGKTLQEQEGDLQSSLDQLETTRGCEEEEDTSQEELDANAIVVTFNNIANARKNSSSNSSDGNGGCVGVSTRRTKS